MENAMMKSRIQVSPTTKNTVKIKTAFTYASGTMAVITAITWLVFTLANIGNSESARAAAGVGLTHVSLTQTTNGLKLLWQTDSKINNNYFTIEQSIDGKAYETIATVQGNTASVDNSYEFIDHYPLLGKTYYRISLTDFDGTLHTFNP